MSNQATVQSNPPVSTGTSEEFPQPVHPVDDVVAVRNRRTWRLIGVSIVGILIRAMVIVVELLAVVFLGSSTLLADALASSTDILATLVIIGAIKLAERPPDDDHPFGHGRYEPLAGWQLGVLMVALGSGFFIWQFISVAQHGGAKSFDFWAVLIPLVAAGFLEATYQLVYWYGRREHSSALIAEAYHYRIDAVTSLLAALSLTLAVMLPQFGDVIDHLGAMLLGAIMVGLGVLACRENLDQLMDRVPDDTHFDSVRDAAMRVEGVLEVEKVRIQHAGPDAHVDIDIEVDPELTVEAAHRISQFVRAEIQSNWPKVREVVVHIEPYYPGDH
ncbi:cation diffusion facilitator family transporter [Calycomorphotria hydatis]|uniref:Putative cation efflux system protein n=1 Tax=Calycomorphotria hydatis TaxID=2528027 RepID=A0A517T5J7_9PLAN|nr:cation diffusion facilitator family transporter [Calycomorphotria hydatis]QDT63647.1 putative cation efflux system protein [Calycomorphotria hydatis]